MDMPADDVLIYRQRFFGSWIDFELGAQDVVTVRRRGLGRLGTRTIPLRDLFPNYSCAGTSGGKRGLVIHAFLFLAYLSMAALIHWRGQLGPLAFPLAVGWAAIQTLLMIRAQLKYVCAWFHGKAYFRIVRAGPDVERFDVFIEELRARIMRAKGIGHPWTAL